MEKKIEIGQKAKVEITWTTSSDHSKEEIKNVKILFAKKYGIPESNVNVVIKYEAPNGNADDGLNAENIKNIQDPVFQQSLFKQYIKENNITDYDFDSLVKIDSQINSLIDFDSYEKGKRYTVKWIDWSNFLSYGPSNHFDFTQLHGLVLLNGEPANKSGKSTFAYDLLHFLLFGETKSGKAKTLAQLFNNFLPDENEVVVEGCINIDGNDYIIKRTLTRAAKSKKATRTASQKVQYYKLLSNGDKQELADTENLQEASSRETSKVIKEAIGNERDFDLIISANMKDLDELISLTEDARGRLLSRWIGLSVLEDKDAIAREKWNKQISVGRYSNIYNRETLKKEIEELENANRENEGTISANKSKITEYEKNIKNYTELKDLALSSKRAINQEVLKAGDMTTLKNKKQSLIDAGKAKSTQIPLLEEKVKSYTDVDYSEDEYKHLQKEKESIIEKTASLRAEIKSLKQTNESLKSAEYCPVCKRKFDNVDNTETIEANKKKIEELTATGVELNERVTKEITPAMESIEKKRELAREKNKLELQIAALKTEVETLRNSYREVSAIITERENNEEAIKHNDEIDAKVNALNASIKTEEGLKREANNLIVTLSGNNERNLAQISEKKGIIVKIKEEAKTERDWKLYLKMIGKDGIGKMVLRNALPIINNELNKLLNDVADFELEVSINEKKDVDFWLVRDGVKMMLSAASGLEKTQSALALRVVLGSMSRLSKPPFILLDEILGATASANLDDMKKLYDKIVGYYSFVLHITHLEQISDWHNQTVTVQKINNISSIKSVL